MVDDDDMNEFDIDLEVVSEFRDAFERAIRAIESKNIHKDIRFELISSLLSIAIQFSIDIEMEKEELIEMIGAIYEEEEEITREENEEIDNSKLN